MELKSIFYCLGKAKLNLSIIQEAFHLETLENGLPADCTTKRMMKTLVDCVLSNAEIEINARTLQYKV